MILVGVALGLAVLVGLGLVWKFRKNVSGIFHTLLSVPKEQTELEGFRKAVWHRYTGEDDSTVVSSETPQPTIPDDLKPQFDEAVEKKVAANFTLVQAAQNKDRALSYVERINDRIINKARGLLPFNSILIALLGLLLRYPPGSRILSLTLVAIAGVTGLLLAISSVLLLWLFVIHWEKPKNFVTFNEEFTHTVELVRDRSLTLQNSILLSGLSFIVILLLSFASVLNGLQTIDQIAEVEHSTVWNLQQSIDHLNKARQEYKDTQADLANAQQTRNSTRQKINELQQEFDRRQTDLQELIEKLQKLKERAQQIPGVQSPKDVPPETKHE